MSNSNESIPMSIPPDMFRKQLDDAMQEVVRAWEFYPKMSGLVAIQEVGHLSAWAKRVTGIACSSCHGYGTAYDGDAQCDDCSRTGLNSEQMRFVVRHPSLP